RPWRRPDSRLQACRAPRAAAEARLGRRERAGPPRSIVRSRRLAHPQLDALGPHAITAPALRARNIASGAPRLLLNFCQERGAGLDRPALIAGRRGDARLARARLPAGGG